MALRIRLARRPPNPTQPGQRGINFSRSVRVGGPTAYRSRTFWARSAGSLFSSGMSVSPLQGRNGQSVRVQALRSQKVQICTGDRAASAPGKRRPKVWRQQAQVSQCAVGWGPVTHLRSVALVVGLGARELAYQIVLGRLTVGALRLVGPICNLPDQEKRPHSPSDPRRTSTNFSRKFVSFCGNISYSTSGGRGMDTVGLGI